MSLRIYRAASRLFLVCAVGATARAAPESAGPPAPSAPPAAASPATPAAGNSAAPSAEPSAPKARPKLSPELLSRLATAVPAWTPPPPAPVEQAPPPPPDPDVVRMAPVVVKDFHLPRIEDQDWLTPKAQDVDLVKRYITPFDRFFLNRITLPLYGISREARARIMYEEDQRLRDLKWMNDEIDQMKRLDPEGAKELQGIRNGTFTRPGE